MLQPLARLLPLRWRHWLFWQRYSMATATALRVMLFGLGLALVFSLVVYYFAQRAESARLLENISGLVVTVESTARIACFTADPTLAAEVAKGLLANRAVASVLITSGSMVLAEEYRYASGDRSPLAGTTVKRKMNSPFNEADAVGEVILVADDAYIREQASRTSSFIVIFSLLEMLLVALAVAWVVLRTIVRPIREFSENLSTLDVDSGEFTAYPKGNELNEVGQLSDAFNNLLAHLFRRMKNEKELSAQLAHKESQFRALAENSPNSIVRYDLDCRRIYCNPAYDSNVGIAPGAALLTTPKQMWRAVNFDGEKFQGILQKVMETSMSSNVMLEWKKEDGHLVINDFHLVPEWDADGKVASVLALGHDISELKKQQRLDADRSLVFERMVRGGELPEVLGMVAGHVEHSFDAYRCAILLLDEDNGCLRIAAAASLPQTFRDAVDHCAVPFPVFDDRYQYWLRFEAEAEHHGFNVCLYEPILDSQKRLLGILALFQLRGDIKAEADVSFMRQACSMAALAIERNRFEMLVQHQASYDALTDLPNRRMFMQKLREKISRASRSLGKVSLLFIDLDRFKGVNDTLGHEIGDLLLVQASSRIRGCVRDYDIVARLGGDEFVVIIPDVADSAVLGGVATAIVETLATPFELNGNTAYISASIGIASFPSDSDNPEQLVSYADQSMYAAKKAGRNGYQFYSKELSNSATEKLKLEFDLRHGIGRGELELYYQPKVSLTDASLTGSEALVRWNHPQLGLVMPEKFISIAEDSGLIVELGEHVLRAACQAASDWNGGSKTLHKLAINLSAQQFKSGNLYQTVCAILQETQCCPAWIELEITESLLLEDSGNVLDTLERFRAMGITIAIDDFGTGYSALSYLARFPIDTLKIDQSFITHVADDGYHAELVKAIITIAHSLNQQVVAEGVNTEQQAAILKACGCHLGQGYLYGQPISKPAFESLLLSFEQTPDFVN